MADSPFEKRKWSLKKKLLIFVALPLLVLVGVALVLDAMAGGRLKTVMYQAREDGGPLTFKELEGARKYWPDQENGAQVLTALQTQLEAISKSETVHALPGFGGNQKDLPLGTRLSPKELAAAEAELKRLEPELAAIDRLKQFKGGHFPLAIAPNPIETLLPNLSPLRTSARLKAAQAQVRAMNGDTTGLVDAAIIIRLHGQLVAEDPFLISALVRVSCDNLTIDTIERTLGLTALSADQLQQLDALLAGMEGQDRLSWGIRGERAGFLGTVEYVRANGGPGLSSLASMADGSVEDSPVTWIPSKVNWIPGVRGLLMQDQATGLDMLNRIVAASKDPRKASAVCRQVEREVVALPPHRLLTRMLLPAMTRAFDLDQRLEANIRAARAALAVERYRLDTGHFPASLDELVSKYLPSVPLDPFDGRPLRYLRDEYGVVVYSIGEDLTDDGGRVDHRVSSKDVHDFGFMLLPPELRNRPATQPATEPAGGGVMTNDEILMSSE